MFYDVFASLCAEKGKSPSAVGQEMGINKSTVSVWKNKHSTPEAETLVLIADYFHVSVDYLLERTKKRPIAGEDDGLTESQVELLKLISDLTPAEISATSKIAQILKEVRQVQDTQQ